MLFRGIKLTYLNNMVARARDMQRLNRLSTLTCNEAERQQE